MRQRVDIYTLLKKLMEIDSTSGKEDHVVDFIAGYLKDSDFEVMLQNVNGKRNNIFAKKDEPDIVFSTHMDTVNPYIPYSEDTDYIYGRGACDAKGSLSVQIKAAEKLVEKGFGKIGLLFVVGEEAGSDGAKKANNIRNKCKYLINGEPTENKLISGSKGAIRIKIVARGKAAHSAYPEQGDSAIFKLIHFLNRWEEQVYPEDKILGKTTWNAGLISGGVQANVIPAHAEAEVMFRTVVSFEKMKYILEKDLPADISLEYIYQADPVILNTAEGFETDIAAFATDVPLLNKWGRPFLMGPGSILDAHTDHEKVKKNDLEKAVDLYCDLTEMLLKNK